jgi:hypothetical protein
MPNRFFVTKIGVDMHRKSNKIIKFVKFFFKSTRVEQHIKSWSRRSRSRIALQLRLRPKDAAPCGSGSATLVLEAFRQKQNFFKWFLGIIHQCFGSGCTFSWFLNPDPHSEWNIFAKKKNFS